VKELRFCWWNVCDYVEYVAEEDKRPNRGPTSEAAYDEKSRRVIAAFDAMYGPLAPELLGLCELTPAAARRLQAVRFPNHELVLSAPDQPTRYQIAVLHRTGAPFAKRLQYVAGDVPRTTRPMTVIDFVSPGVEIEFVFCHWTAFDDTQSAEYRRRLADALRTGLHQFLNPAPQVATARHVVVVGDLNAEPFDPIFDSTLSARRYRSHATQREHWSDADVRRVRLYNCAWRFLGEQSAHTGSAPLPAPAGTYYRRVEGNPRASGWHAFDQILVSGGLLEDRPPYLDESRLSVRGDVGNLHNGTPRKFEMSDGGAVGLSDHLPLTGRIVLA